MARNAASSGSRRDQPSPPISAPDGSSDEVSSDDEEEDWLSERLFDCLSPSDFEKDSRKFIPEGVLDKLITRESILHAMGIGRPSAVDEKLVQFILQKAKKVFATLVSIKLDRQGSLHRAMVKFMEYKVDDSRLPIVDTDDQTAESVLVALDHKRKKKIWSRSTIQDFCDDQWRFLVPVFSTDAKTDVDRYNLPVSTIIPFVKKHADFDEGSFGKVYKYEIHPDHIKDPLRPGMPCPKVVAVKEIRPGDNARQKVTKHWESEIKALERVNELNHGHIVRFIAAFTLYQKDRKDHYLMFEWADGGNLKTLWEETDQPTLCAPLIKTAIQQLFGLAGALAKAHYLPNNASCRHGDLKPANILRFDDGSEIGTLKIGDWGEAKEHKEVTEFRFNRTTAQYATHRYQPPEAEIGVDAKFLHQSRKRRTRLYDIWAMGCITLEFMIWLLYGREGLAEFNSEFTDNSPFYEITNEGGEQKAKVHRVAMRWMDHLAKNSICQLDRALGRLLEIVREGLLVVKLPRRTGSGLASRSDMSAGSRLPGLPNSDSTGDIFNDESFHSDTDPSEQPMANIPSIQITATEPAMIPVEAMPETPGPARLLATDFAARLEDILGEEDANESYWFIDTMRPMPSSDPSHSNHAPAHGDEATGGRSRSTGSLGFQNNEQMSSTGLIAPEAERVDYAHPNLDDEWELQNDNEFASSLFSALKKSDSFHFTEACATSHLCNQCQTIRDRLLLPGFSITYDTTVLAHRSAINECNLCSLLWKTCEQQGHFAYPTVTFERVGSSLRINGSGVPALSIYRSPNLKNPAADSIQISFAELPEAGQSTHLKLIREWLKHCDNEQNHPTCKRGSNTRDEGKRTVPTRLIDVGAIGDNRVRLVPTIGGDCGEWVALSHQWGAGPYFSTNRKNLMDHMEGINLSDLPPTFRDAVTVTRGVGLRYLWIDSICIIQGPDGDFNQEAKRMEGVYSNAYCVIAASRADNHYSGYLRQRRARESVVMSREKEAPFYICEVIDDFKTHVLDGGLNARGWVMQEHALARRTIFFTDHQTYWECGEGVWCETMIKMKNNLAAFLGDPNFPQILIDAPQGEKILRCQKLYQTYSRLGLSNPYDRPMAIDGLQRRLLRTMKAKGSFGVFDEGGARGLLRRSLLWHRGSDTQSLTRIKFPTNRSASAIPSWSWMAYTGAIDYLKLDFGGCKWMDIGTPWSGSADKVARTEDHASSIALTGEAKTYEYRPKDFNPNAAVQHEGLLLFDSPGGSEKLRTMCVVLGIEQGPKPLAERMHYLILIKPSNALVPESNKIYERVGAGYLPGKCIKPNGFKVIIH